jgi:DNA-binding transcriptional LysR family regulator
MRREVTQLARPADSAHMLLNLAIAGVGIIRFGDIIVAQAIRDGLLMPVLEDWQETESPRFGRSTTQGRQRTPRVKAFVDFLTEHFGQTPWRARPTK